MWEQTPYLRELIVFLAAAGLVVPLARRFRINPVLGFLSVGLLVGPHAAGRLAAEAPFLGHILIADTEGVRRLAEFGVVFLLFTIGLELSFQRLWAMRRLVFGLGSAQVLASGLIIGSIAFAFGNSPSASALLGLSLALSSTAIVVQLLAEKFRLSTPAGRTGFGVLLLQDLAVIPILFLVHALGDRPANTVLPIDLVVTLGQAGLFIVLTLLIGRVLIRPLFRLVGGSRSRELFMAAVLLVILGTALLAEVSGLSMALGAFLVGLLFAGTEYRHQINADIEPFKGLLLALFFISLGMTLDPAAVWENAGMVLASVAGLMAIKSAILFLLARAFRLPLAVATESALLLCQGGEFAFVVIATAMPYSLIAADIAQFMLMVVIITMFLTPFVAHVARRLAAWIEQASAAGGAIPVDSLDGHVIIAGFGRVGRIVARMLDEQRIPYVALDQDPAITAHFRELGSAVYFGDATNQELLARLGGARAAAFVSTLDEPRAAERAVAAAHRAWAQLPIFARARDSAEAARLAAAGASVVIPETVEASLQLGESLLSRFDVPEETVVQMIEQHRIRGI